MLTEQWIKILRERRMKITPQRRFIFQALEQKRTDHPTVDDIYNVVRQTLPDISLTTVYNTMRELVTMGLLRQVDLGEGMTRFDPTTSTHHHLLCVHCGRLEDLFRQFDNLNLPPEESKGYEIINHQVIFEGLCPDCQRAEETGNE
ncbi:MAG: transcriptional repressor [Caldilineae bacterium]|nr:MAG: transcriptional repressor [Caldilineae bacterium]